MLGWGGGDRREEGALSLGTALMARAWVTVPEEADEAGEGRGPP